MKVTVFSTRRGRQTIDLGTALSTKSFGDSLRDCIQRDLDAVAEVLISPARIRDLLRRLQTRSETEAARIFPTAISIINKAQTGPTRHGVIAAFDANEIAGRGAGTTLNAQFRQAGSVYWQNLDPKWVEYKHGLNPAVAKKFFEHRGDLKAYLARYQSGFVGRLGGIKVKSKIAPPARGGRTQLRRVLAELEVRVFPGVSAGLMPMLSSGRWTSHNNGDFERVFFGGKVAQKLAGPDGRHRALFLPLVQFWAAFRIPRAINEAVASWLVSPRGGA